MKIPSTEKINLKKITILGLVFLLTSSATSFSADFLVSQPPKSMDKYYSDPGMPSEWTTEMQKLSIAFSTLFFNIEKK